MNLFDSKIPTNVLLSKIVRQKKLIDETNKQFLQIMTRKHEELTNYIKHLQQLLYDMTKRLLNSQHKYQDCTQQLLKYQSPFQIKSIQDKYQKIIPIENPTLLALINTFENKNKHNFNAQKSIRQEINQLHFYNQGTNDQQQCQQGFKKYMRNIKPLGKSTLRKSTNIYSIEPQTTTKQQNLQPPLEYQLSSSSEQMEVVHPPRNIKKNINKKEPLCPRIPIKIDQPSEQQQMSVEIKQKQIHKLQLQRQYSRVANFIHNFLALRLKYNEDHRRYCIPKRRILSIYFEWCRQNKQKIILKKHSVIQMGLTNQLKAAFPGINVQSRFYRGLFFWKTFQNNLNQNLTKSSQLMDYHTLYQ